MNVIHTAQSEVPEKKPRSALLPLLIVLFVISYSILTLLVVEQGRTIDVQRGLLREMLKDSSELAAIKSKLAREEAMTRAQEKPTPQTHQQDPGTGGANAGSASAAPKMPGEDAKPLGKSRSMKQIPQTPASDLEDVRRSTRVI